MKYFSMFSGIGGFEYGIHSAHSRCKTSRKVSSTQDMPNINEWWVGRSEATCVGFSEVDKYAKQIYKKHFKEHKDYGDCTKIDYSTVPDFDCLVGGFPCQAFSIAGKRGGFEDTRGTLFFEIARCLKEKQPRLCVLENVKGLLSHDKGATFLRIVTTLSELGYDCQWQVLNSKNFGVPQNRERVFIVGHLRGTSRPEVFPITTQNPETIGTGGVVGALQARYAQGDRTGGYVAKKEINQINNPKHSNDRVYGDDGISPTLNTMQGGKRQPFIAPVLTPDREEKRQNGRRFKDNGDPAFTLTAQDKHGIYDGIKIRRLTPTECERLQGFPDGWTEGISDTQRYKCLGNAVTTNVITAIFQKLFD